ncbi:unnamed protein product, partial [Ectocarpus sp. 8 AP-2014]
MVVRLQSSAFEQRSGSECRQMNTSTASLGSMFWLQRLKWMVFELDTPVRMAPWPASLQQLSFGDHFNRPIAEVVWPASLQQLEFGDEFNQPIAEVEWPASLQYLSFGDEFNQ